MDSEGDNITALNWTFSTNDAGYDLTTYQNTTGGNLTFLVGNDHLIPEFDYNDPVMPEYNSPGINYTIALVVRDEHGNAANFTMNVTVFPYAGYHFKQPVKLGASLLDASVDLVWRGFPGEAAPGKHHISPERPVFVYIDTVDSPVPDLEYHGGIGHVYDLRSVGCFLQNGEEGFIIAEIRLPILTSELEAIGDAFTLQGDLRLEYYNETEERFLVIPDSHVIADGGVKYVVGEVNHFSIFSAIVDSVYNPSHPNYQANLPDLIVAGIELSRDPIIDGQTTQVRTIIRNLGKTNARDIPVSVYLGESFISTVSIEFLQARGAEDESITMNIIVSMIDPNSSLEEQFVIVIVNEDRSIEEAPDDLDNNMGNESFQVLPQVHHDPSIFQNVTITSPMNHSIIQRTINFQGSSSLVVTPVEFSLQKQPFGNNDFSFHVVQVEPYQPSVLDIVYVLHDNLGKPKPGTSGFVKDIYGLAISSYTSFDQHISFQDNDRDGKMSPGDVFLGIRTSNGGIFEEFDTLHLELGSEYNVDTIQMSVNNGNWSVLSGTGEWSIGWDTTNVPDGNTSLRFRAQIGESYSSITELFVTVDNIPDNTQPIVNITHSVSGRTVFHGVAYDVEGTISLVELSIDGGDWFQVSDTPIWSYTWDTSDEKDGFHTIIVRSYDGVKYSEQESMTIKVRNVGDDGDDDWSRGTWVMIALLGNIIGLSGTFGYLIWKK